MYAMTLVALVGFAAPDAQTPRHDAELVFPLHPQHNHAPGIVECPNGDLLVSWYRGSGRAHPPTTSRFTVRARRPAADKWGDAFLMADTPGFPDCNTDDVDRQATASSGCSGRSSSPTRGSRA